MDFTESTQYQEARSGQANLVLITPSLRYAIYTMHEIEERWSSTLIIPGHMSQQRSGNIWKIKIWEQERIYPTCPI
jgi:hypothetical protein